jgi:hypothetical protein
LTEDSDGGNEWIFSPFSMNTVSKAKITDDLQDNIIDMTTDRRFQTIFKEKCLSKFWCEVSKDYPSLGRSAVTAVRKNVFCYAINQNQAEKLPAAATRLDPRRQYHPA